MRNQTIFVTGATGVIGKRVVPLLVDAGHRVTAVCRSDAKRAALVRAGAQPVSLDLFDAAAVRRAVVGHDVVINLATHVPPITRTFVPGAWHKTNQIRRVVSANLASALLAAGGARMIQESFAPIYADAGDRWIDEASPIRPARYNRAVLDAEGSAQRVSQAGGVGIALRFGYFYGPDSEFTRDQFRFIRQGRAPYLGRPDGYFSEVHHDDVATAVVAALDLPAGLYNVTDDRPLTRRQVADGIAATLGVAPPRFFPTWVSGLAGSLGELLARSQRISNARLRESGNWTARFPDALSGMRSILAERNWKAEAAA